MVGKLILRNLGRIVLVTLAGFVLGGMLVRLAPGFGTDEQDLNPLLSSESRKALRAQRASDATLTEFWVRYGTSILHGDLGVSTAFERPVVSLIRERLSVTLPLLGFGAFFGLAIGLIAATGSALAGSRTTEWLATGSSAVLLAAPAVLLGLVFFWADWPAHWAVALMVAPHIYRYSNDVLRAYLPSPHLVHAHALGLPPWRIWLNHIARPLGPEMCSICGSAVTLAFGACIPIEVVCDLPGIGQFAWKSALSRDLPAVVSVTVLVALLNSAANSIADVSGALLRGDECLR